MRPPPRWIRRLVLVPVAITLTLVFVAASPAWLAVATLASAFSSGRLRPVRVLWLLTTYLVVETAALATMFLLWLAAGCGVRLHEAAFQRAHYAVAGAVLRTLYRQARWVLRLSVVIEGATPDRLPAGEPVLVLSRHAGPGDSFLLMHALINWYARTPSVVVKSALQWDPLVDVLLHRLPSRFIVPGAEAAEEQIAALATDLSANDALVIFPEGGNFTPERWIRAIDRLHSLGLHGMARRAERMRNVLPPRPGGVLAALAASPQAQVVLVGHTGVDHLRTVADVWRELPMDKTITMHWWRSRGPVPAGRDEDRIEWLYAWWARIDAWITANRPPALPDGKPSGVAMHAEPLPGAAALAELVEPPPDAQPSGMS